MHSEQYMVYKWPRTPITVKSTAAASVEPALIDTQRESNRHSYTDGSDLSVIELVRK